MYFYQKGDLIDNFYFTIRGVGAFVRHGEDNALVAIIDPVIYAARKRSRKLNSQVNVHQYFGAEDIVINVAAQIHDSKRRQGDFSFQKNGFVINSRYFSV